MQPEHRGTAKLHWGRHKGVPVEAGETHYGVNASVSEGDFLVLISDTEDAEGNPVDTDAAYERLLTDRDAAVRGDKGARQRLLSILRYRAPRPRRSQTRSTRTARCTRTARKTTARRTRSHRTSSRLAASGDSGGGEPSGSSSPAALAAEGRAEGEAR